MMNAFVIAYDLETDQSSEHYQRVADAIATCGTVIEIQYSVWILASRLTATEIRDAVANELDEADRLFVGKLTGYSSRRFPSRASELLSSAWHKT